MELAFALLVAALALFWLSTRQFPLVARGAVWIVGAAALAWTAATSASQTDFGIWSAVEDAWAGREQFRETAIGRALSLNAQNVAPFLAQLLDFFVVTCWPS